MKAKGTAYYISIFIITSLLFLGCRETPPSYKKIQFPSTIVIKNQTQYKECDTIILALSHLIFKIDQIHVSILYFPENLNVSEQSLGDVFIRIDNTRNNGFYLFLRKNLPHQEIEELLCLEFIHIDQYLRGDLIFFDDRIIWKGEIFKYKDFDYYDLPHNVEAYTIQDSVVSKLKDVLYLK